MNQPNELDNIRRMIRFVGIAIVITNAIGVHIIALQLREACDRILIIETKRPDVTPQQLEQGQPTARPTDRPAFWRGI